MPILMTALFGAFRRLIFALTLRQIAGFESSSKILHPRASFSSIQRNCLFTHRTSSGTDQHYCQRSFICSTGLCVRGRENLHMDQSDHICYGIQRFRSHKTQKLESRTRTSLPLVSKGFNVGPRYRYLCGLTRSLKRRQQRLSQPVLYAHPSFSRYNELVLFAKRLTSDPSLERHVRSLLFPKGSPHFGTSST